jgi:hypothetical protein
MIEKTVPIAPVQHMSLGPKMSRMAPDMTEIENRKKIAVAPSQAIVDWPLDESWAEA